jgi:hypothetical protein
MGQTESVAQLVDRFFCRTAQQKTAIGVEAVKFRAETIGRKEGGPALELGLAKDEFHDGDKKVHSGNREDFQGIFREVLEDLLQDSRGIVLVPLRVKSLGGEAKGRTDKTGEAKGLRNGIKNSQEDVLRHFPNG